MFQFSPDTLVELVDRTLKGGTEIFYAGQPLVFKQGEIKKIVPREFVAWLYQTEKTKVWTTDGEFVQRFAVEAPPQWLIDNCGPEVGDCAPIELDTARLEGWDTSTVTRDDRTKTIKNNIPASEVRERQGAGARVSFVPRG